MKTIVAILFSVLIAFQTLYPGLAGIYFQLNKTYIQNNLCENRDWSVLPNDVFCGGKCYLQKVMSEDDNSIQLGLLSKPKKEKEEHPHKPSQKEKETLLFFQVPTTTLSYQNTVVLYASPQNSNKQYIPYYCSYPRGQLAEIFTPPDFWT